MTNTEHLIPLTKHEQLSAAMPLHDLVPSLALDRRRLDRLATLGCFSEINFEVESEEPTAHNAEASDPQGQAICDKTPTQSNTCISRSYFDASDPNSFRYLHTSPPLTISINRAAVRARAEQNQASDLGEYWQQTLNHAIGKAATRAAWRHLVGNAQLGEIVTAGTAVASVKFAEWMCDFSMPYLGIPMAIGLANASELLCTQEIPRKKRCYSFIPGFHIDRVLAVRALATLKPVIRTIK